MTTLVFDPNNVTGSKAPVWATYIPSRSLQFKTHTKRNHATNAMNYRAGSNWSGPGKPSIMYEFVDGKWVERERYEPPTNCAHCGRDFDEVALKKSSARYYYAKCHTVHDRKVSPSYRQKRVCQECYNKHFCYDAEDKIAPELCGLIQTEY